MGGESQSYNSKQWIPAEIPVTQIRFTTQAGGEKIGRVIRCVHWVPLTCKGHNLDIHKKMYFMHR